MRSNINESRDPTFIEQVRREQIIAAASAVVAEVGYAQASLSKIAARAGISKSVVSYYFKGKDDLLEQVVMRIFYDGWAEMSKRMADQRDHSGRLRAWITAELEFMAADPVRFKAMSAIVVNHLAGDGRPRYAQEAESAIEAMAELLRAGQRSGEFGDFDPRILAVIIRRSVEGALSEWAMHPDIDLGAYGRQIIAVVEAATTPTAPKAEPS